MGKYTLNNLGYEPQKAGEEILLFIANELHEMNRLTRLKINLSIYRDEYTSTEANLIQLAKELEDQA